MKRKSKAEQGVSDFFGSFGAPRFGELSEIDANIAELEEREKSLPGEAEVFNRNRGLYGLHVPVANVKSAVHEFIVNSKRNLTGFRETLKELYSEDSPSDVVETGLKKLGARKVPVYSIEGRYRRTGYIDPLTEVDSGITDIGREIEAFNKYGENLTYVGGERVDFNGQSKVKRFATNTEGVVDLSADISKKLHKVHDELEQYAQFADVGVKTRKALDLAESALGKSG